MRHLCLTCISLLLLLGPSVCRHNAPCQKSVPDNTALNTYALHTGHVFTSLCGTPSRSFLNWWMCRAGTCASHSMVCPRPCVCSLPRATMHPLLSVSLEAPPPPVPSQSANEVNVRWWLEALIIDAVDTNWPTQQASCSVCACFAWVHHYRPLLGMPRRRGGGRPRPESSLPLLIFSCDRELWFHSSTRLTKIPRETTGAANRCDSSRYFAIVGNNWDGSAPRRATFPARLCHARAPARLPYTRQSRH